MRACGRRRHRRRVHLRRTHLGRQCSCHRLDCRQPLSRNGLSRCLLCDRSVGIHHGARSPFFEEGCAQLTRPRTLRRLCTRALGHLGRCPRHRLGCRRLCRRRRRCHSACCLRSECLLTRRQPLLGRLACGHLLAALRLHRRSGGLGRRNRCARRHRRLRRARLRRRRARRGHGCGRSRLHLSLHLGW